MPTISWVSQAIPAGTSGKYNRGRHPLAQPSALSASVLAWEYDGKATFIEVSLGLVPAPTQLWVFSFCLETYESLTETLEHSCENNCGSIMMQQTSFKVTLKIIRQKKKKRKTIIIHEPVPPVSMSSRQYLPAWDENRNAWGWHSGFLRLAGVATWGGCPPRERSVQLPPAAPQLVFGWYHSGEIHTVSESSCYQWVFLYTTPKHQESSRGKLAL